MQVSYESGNIGTYKLGSMFIRTMRSEMLPSILLTPLVSESAGEFEREAPVAHFNSRACSNVGLLQSLQTNRAQCNVGVNGEGCKCGGDVTLVQPSRTLLLAEF
jgi:hypothetical protein